jgi:hypothetical protein
VDDIYDGNYRKFDFDGLENQMEGKFRPLEVGTVVNVF